MTRVPNGRNDEHVALLLGVLDDGDADDNNSPLASSFSFGELVNNYGATQIGGGERRSLDRSAGSYRVIVPQEGLSPTITTFIVINYISVGYVLLPASFARAGTLLSTAVLIAVSLQSYLTATMVLEACARAETLEMVFSRRGTRRVRDLPRSYSMEVRQHKFELSVLSKIFLGKHCAKFFTVTTALDLYGITWAISSIFASALVEQVPLLWKTTTTLYADHDDFYQIYVLVFMSIAIPLSCTSMLDQLNVQMAFLAARMLMVLCMLATLLHAYLHPDRCYFRDQVGPAIATNDSSIPLANWHGILPTIQICIFATAFQFSVPAIGGVSRNKTVLANIFRAAIGFICVSNLLVCLASSLYFGTATKASNNLNWIDYHGGDDSDLSSSVAKWISSYIVLFAAVDGIAVYPLITVSLGDILMGAFYGEAIHEVENDGNRRILFRLLASVPQAIGSMFVKDLGVIAVYGAIFTLLSYTVCPALLAIQSERRMKKDALPVPTYYSLRWLPSVQCAKILIVLAIAIIVGVLLTGR